MTELEMLLCVALAIETTMMWYSSQLLKRGSKAMREARQSLLVGKVALQEGQKLVNQARVEIRRLKAKCGED